MNRHVRAYKALVRLYPARFRDDFADEMVMLFADQLHDARSTGSRVAVARLWLTSVADLARTAPQQHLEQEEPMPQTVEPGSVPSSEARGPDRAATTAAAVPLLLWAFLMLAAPGFTDPLYMIPPAIFGLPLGIAGMSIAVPLAFAGLVMVRRARTRRTVVVALACLTVPATVLIAILPTLVVVLQGLSV